MKDTRINTVLGNICLLLLGLVGAFQSTIAQDCSTAAYNVCEGEAIVAQYNPGSANENADYTHVYILTDAAGLILEVSTTGSFAVQPLGNYEIYMLNYATADAPTIDPQIAVGNDINALSLSGGCITVTAIMADPPSDFGCDEYVIITNSSGVAVDISGWTITDGAGLRHTFPAGSSIPANGTLQTFVRDFVDPPATCSETSATGVFNNSSADFAMLADAAGVMISTLNYGPSAPDGMEVTQAPGACACADLEGPQAASVANDNPGCAAEPCTSVLNICPCDGDIAEIEVNLDGNNADLDTWYVAINDDDGAITANQTGMFPGLPDGNYTIYAYNYDPLDPNAAAILAAITAGDIAALTGYIAAGDCLDDAGSIPASVNAAACGCVPEPCTSVLNVCPCNGDAPDIEVNLSGNNTDLETWFVLLDGTAAFVSANMTGMFTGLADGDYTVYAYNIDPLDPNYAAIAAAVAIGDIAALTAFIAAGDCLDDAGSVPASVNGAACGCTTDCTSVLEACNCDGSDGALSIFTEGFNETGFTQYIVYTDASGNIVGWILGPGGTVTLPTGIYDFYAYNVEDASAFDFEAAAVVGAPLSDLDDAVTAGGWCVDNDNAVTVQGSVNQCLPTVDPIDDPQPVCASAGTVDLDAIVVNPMGGQWYTGTDNTGTAVSGAQTVANGDNFYYEVTGAAPDNCTVGQAITVSVVPDPIVTIDPAGPYCLSDATVQLIASPAGGVWGGDADATGMFDPATAGTGPNTVTYDFTDANGCSGSAQIEIFVAADLTPTIVSAGPYCSDEGIITLSAGPAGGVWGGDAAADGTFDASIGAGSYTVTYETLTTTDCGGMTSATFEVYDRPDAGSDVELLLCETAAGPIDLNTLITGDTGGNWSPNDSFDPATGAGVYTFTYQVQGGGGCDDEATVTVEVTGQPNAGDDGAISVCDDGSDNAFNLSSILGGSPSIGGSWTNANGDPASSVFIVGFTPAGDYTYTVDPGAPCISDAATVSVTVDATVNAGSDGYLNLCDNQEGVFNLFDSLNGTPDVGGTWSNGTGTFDPGADVSGVYTYTVAANGSCPEASATVSVNLSNELDAGEDFLLEICGELTASTDLFALLGGTPDLGGTWTDTESQPWDGILEPGDPDGLYTYTVYSGDACPIVSAWVEVLYYIELDAGDGGAATLCSNDGAIDLMSINAGTPVSGGTWAPALASGSSIFDPAVDAGGSYVYSVPANGVCAGTSATVVVTVNAAPDEATDTDVATCSADGTTTLTAPAGYSYVWFDGSTGTSVTVGSSGTYNLQLSSGSCTQDIAYHVSLGTIPAEAQPDAVTICEGDGPVTLIAPNGYSYSWSGGSDDQFIVVSSAGTYPVTISNAEGCSQTLNYTVIVSASPNEAPNISQILCSDDAPVIVTAPDGYSYEWADGSTDQSISVSVTGAYNVSLTNAAGCSQTIAYSVLVLDAPAEDQPAAVTICDGPAMLNAPGGYAYHWSDGSTAGSLSASTSGIYTVTLSNGAGCSQDLTYDVTIDQTPAEAAPAAVVACEESGPVSLTAPAGYTYSWSDGSTGQSVTAAASGTYSVTLGNGSACTQTLNYEVQIIAQPAEETSIDVSACASDGALSLTAPSGYDYAWADGSTEQAIEVSAAGSYTVSISNSAGCSLDVSYNVTLNDAPSEPNGPVQNICGVGNATLDGPAGYSYAWSTGSDAQSISAGAGVYQLEITNADGCSQTLFYIVNNNSIPNEASPSAVEVCSADGEVSLTGPDGYSYNWSNGSTAQDIAVSASGTYSLTIANSNGCTQVLEYPVTINSSPAVAMDAIGSFCEGDASVLLSGGSPAGGSYSGVGVTGGMFDPALAGTGTHTITYDYVDANGCSGSASTAVTVNGNPDVSIDPINGSLCADGGVVQLTASPAGGSWGGSASAGGSIDPAALGAGAYSATYLFTDANGCSEFASLSFDVSELPAVSIAEVSGPLCSGSADVLLTGSPAGGTWTGASINGIFSPESAGSYDVTYDYSDANGCSASASISITVDANADASIVAVDPVCSDADPFLLTSAQAGGQWSGTGVLAFGQFNPADAGVGSHTVTYTIGGNCGDSQSIVIVVEDCGPADCTGFFAAAEAACTSDGLFYSVVLSFSGGPNSGSGYNIVNNLTGETIATGISETLIEGPFDNGSAYSYTVSILAEPDCSLVFENSLVECGNVAIELIEFDGRVEEEGNMLYWSTASEFENDYFELQRSLDGTDFEPIAQVDATGNSNITTNYYHIDEDAPRGWSYYRLHVIDIDGNVDKTQIVPLYRPYDDKGDLTVTPVPTTDFINLSFQADRSDKVDFEIYDATGRLMRVIEVETIEGFNETQVDVRSYPTGAYLVRMNSANSMVVRKFIVD